MVTDWNRGHGGAEAYMGLLRRGLRDAGDEVRLLTSSAGSAADGTADYIAFGTGSVALQAVLQIANPFAVRAVRRAVSGFGPDVAYVNMFANHLSPVILHALGDVPIVLMVSDYKCICPIGSKLLPDGSLCTRRAGWVCHESGCVSLPHWLRDRPRYALLRSGLRRASRILACSEWVRVELLRAGIDSERVYLPIAQPHPSYVRSRAPEPRILYCGRLDREKGVADLIGAFGMLAATNSRATLRIAGRGPERAALEALAKDLGLQTRVFFSGWLSPADVERELAAAWVMAVPSLWAEPFGLVAPEAIVRGVPVIASGTGGLAETVEEDVSGLLFPNGDVTALAEKLAAVVDRQSFANGLPADVIRRVGERHDLTRHVDQLRATFRDLIN